MIASDVPTTFPSQRLKYSATINDQTLSEITDPDFQLQYIDIGNVDSSGNVHEVVTYRFEDAPSRARRLVREGDVIVSTVRTYLKAIAPILNPPDGLVVSTGFAVVRPRNGVLYPGFCKYLLREPRFLFEVEARSVGVSYPAINSSDLGDIRVVLPPLKDQQRIADYLDAETAEIDALIAEKGRMLSLLEEKRVSLVTDAVTRGLNPQARMRDTQIPWLGDVPIHWETKRLKFLADVRTGLTIGKDYGTRAVSDYYYLRVANVQDGYLSLDDLTTVAVPESEAASCLLEPGDVLMNEGGDIDKLGRGCVWRGEVSPCLHQNHVFCVRPHSVNPDWLATFTATASAKLYFESRAKRTTNLASISSTNIKEVTVPLPPENEQEQIVAFLKKCNSRLDDVRDSTTNAVALLKERRSALIMAAVTGQISFKEMGR
jgi:type I restriction enzyme S subunit